MGFFMPQVDLVLRFVDGSSSFKFILYEDLPGNVFFEIISFPQVEKTNADFSSTFATLWFCGFSGSLTLLI